MRETDLYGPVRDFLVAQGFTVRAEVHGCDVAGQRGEELVVVELKCALTLALLLQAIRRQRLADSVYVAIPRPATGSQDAKLRQLRPLLRRLELGLLAVDLRAQPASITVVQQPLPAPKRREQKKRRALLAELGARTGDDNVGGSTRRPLVTVYRENALHVAVALQRFGPLAPRQLRALGAAEKTASILQQDVYGWFERIERGLYHVRPAGLEALAKYAGVAARLRARLPEKTPGHSA